MEKFDLHTHSNLSDGTLRPAELVAEAQAAGISLLALTDHDCTLGVREAMEAGERLGVRIVPGLEMDTEFTEELHLLGLGINPEHDGLAAFMAHNARRRLDRNEAILQKLEGMGIPVRPLVAQARGTVTRLDVALALVQGGYAEHVAAAFETYLGRGKPAYAESKRIQPEDAIRLIHEAGGLAVLAHPCKLKADVHAMADRLSKAGLDGIEALYPTATPGQRAAHISLARQYGLLVTAGSDFHGTHRPNQLGAAWVDDPVLEGVYDTFVNRGLSAPGPLTYS